MSLTFHCPNCGAPLDPPTHNETLLRCPFCHSSVIVPEEIRGQPRISDTLTRDQVINALPDSSQQMMQIIRLIKDGNKEESIHIFREAFDSSRSDAENAIQAIEQGQLVSLFHLRKQAGLPSASEPPIERGSQTNKTAQQWLTIGCVIFMVLIVALVGIFFLLTSVDSPLRFATEAPRLALNRSFGSEGLMPGQFTQAQSIAVDLQGNSYISDLKTGRIQQFDAQGNFLHLWDASDDKLIIWDLEVDQDGILYVAAERNILRYDTRNGDQLDPIPNPDQYFFYDIAILPDGSLVAVTQNTTLVRMNPDGSSQWVVENPIHTLTDESDTSGSLCVDGNNNIYLAGSFVRTVLKFSPKGVYLNRWGSEGDEPGQFETIYAIAINPQGQVVVDDWGELEIYDTDGRFIEQIETGKILLDIAFNSSGLLYAIENQKQVLVFQINTP